MPTKPHRPWMGLRWLLRATIVGLAAASVAAAALLTLGPPSLARAYQQNEIARFAPTVGHGIGQFLGETFLLALVAYVGRRWLRIRL